MLAFVVGWLTLVPSLLVSPASVEPSSTSPASDVATLSGKVVELAEALKSLGLSADAETVAHQVVVLASDGTITPLLCDDASRALFKDERLRHRSAELMVKRRAGLPYVQVLTFQVEDHGKLRTPEYFCEICSISVRSPQVCICCQGPMELRFKTETP
ncbi:MAG TPA: hypothetical protein VGZ22_25280 [Isosphaeraceae bacterium]|jgi:hypothetical protein|nr:hypothetical protein [Isosphaeraceae bacterium]